MILISIYILFLFTIHASPIEFEDKSIILKNDFYSIEAVQIKENKIKIYKEISKELGLQIKINFDEDEVPQEILILDGGEELSVTIKNYEIESLYLKMGDTKKAVQKDEIDTTIVENIMEQIKSPFFIDELWYRIQERERVEEK
ncbi:MAG: hypothetical protein ACRC8M_02935 [Cetobacterium sp.]|uniref:hypothetical protein n=1 Tax=Cetobacterium sp. TaxID=2071632 RepID=UPI003F410F0D